VVGFLGDGTAVRLLRRPVALAARTAHGPAQELRLLVRLHEAITPALLIGPWSAPIDVGLATLLTRLLEAAVLAIGTVVPILAVVLTLLAILPIRAVAEAMLVVAPAALAALEALIVLVVLIVEARLRLKIMAHRRMRRLQLALITILVELVARIHRIMRHELAIAVHALAVHRVLTVGPHVLLTERHDDAVVVLGVLQIVLRQHRIAG
jgi:hypothetical protein